MLIFFFFKFVILLEAAEKRKTYLRHCLYVLGGPFLLLPRIEQWFLDYPSHVIITVLPELPPVRNEYVED